MSGDVMEWRYYVLRIACSPRLQARIAIYAAKNARKGQHWGGYAARQYCVKRRVPLRLFYTALDFEERRKT
jgi:hypothetical protein